jgi:hypothetical protein
MYSSSWKHGKYSAVLPTRLIAAYEESIANPENIEMTHEIGVLDTRISELLDRVDKGEAGALWNKLVQTASEAVDAADGGTEDGTELALGLLHDVLKLAKRGESEWKAWGEVASLIEQRRKVVDTEGKRQDRERRSMNMESLAALILVIRTIIFEETMRYVPDPVARREYIAAVAGAFERLVLANSGRGTQAYDGNLANELQELGDGQTLLTTPQG